MESLYKTKQTVFAFKEISLLLSESNINALKSKINYYVRSGKLTQVRRGIYCLESYDKEELACKLYSPTYISLEYVLQKEGVIFQYQETITSLSGLTRLVLMGEQKYSYRKIKRDILLDTTGVKMLNNINIATKERAILDILYMNKDYYFDNLTSINKTAINNMLEKVYECKALTQRAKRILNV